MARSAIARCVLATLDNHRTHAGLHDPVAAGLAEFSGFLIAATHIAITEHATAHQTVARIAFRRKSRIHRR